MKKVKKIVNKKNGCTIVSSDELVGTVNGLIDDNTGEIFVSPAIFELLQDDQVKDMVMNQVKLISLQNFLKEVKNRLEKQNEKKG